MAKELQEFPETRGRAKGESQYPWETWFDGKIRQLEGGDDFTCKLSSFRSTVAKEAKARKVKIRTAIVNGGKDLVVAKIGSL